MINKRRGRRRRRRKWRGWRTEGSQGSSAQGLLLEEGWEKVLAREGGQREKGRMRRRRERNPLGQGRGRWRRASWLRPWSPTRKPHAGRSSPLRRSIWPARLSCPAGKTGRVYLFICLIARDYYLTRLFFPFC